MALRLVQNAGVRQCQRRLPRPGARRAGSLQPPHHDRSRRRRRPSGGGEQERRRRSFIRLLRQRHQHRLGGAHRGQLSHQDRRRRPHRRIAVSQEAQRRLADAGIQSPRVRQFTRHQFQTQVTHLRQRVLHPLREQDRPLVRGRADVHPPQRIGQPCSRLTALRRRPIRAPRQAPKQLRFPLFIRQCPRPLRPRLPRAPVGPEIVPPAQTCQRREGGAADRGRMMLAGIGHQQGRGGHRAERSKSAQQCRYFVRAGAFQPPCQNQEEIRRRPRSPRDRAEQRRPGTPGDQRLLDGRLDLLAHGGFVRRGDDALRGTGRLRGRCAVLPQRPPRNGEVIAGRGCLNQPPIARRHRRGPA